MTDIIRNTIKRFASGYVFTAEDFPVEVGKQNTVSKILSNMIPNLAESLNFHNLKFALTVSLQGFSNSKICLTFAKKKITYMLLLHACCAPCSAAILEWLQANRVPVTLFFFNPNIAPPEEYERRKGELKRYAHALGIDFIDGDYDHERWLDAVRGLENQPERGSRCLECFKLRLRATAQLADTHGFTQIATTLASSRWKSLEQIAAAGQWAVEPFPNVQFWAKNWRKDGLSERRRILLQKNNFYNQTYCGCEFSQNL